MTWAWTGRAVGLPRYRRGRADHLRSSNHGSRQTHGSVQLAFPASGSKDAGVVIEILQDRLNALNDLALTLKHIHWNVVGPHFIAVHTMLDPQVDAVRLMVDETAERIATLGGSPAGTPGALVAARSWDDYSLGRDDAHRPSGRARPGLRGDHRGSPQGDRGDG